MTNSSVRDSTKGTTNSSGNIGRLIEMRAAGAERVGGGGRPYAHGLIYWPLLP